MESLVVFNISYLLISCVIGIFGNVIIILVFQKRKQKVSTDILVIALAVSDLMSSLLFIVPITWTLSNAFRIRFSCAFLWLLRRVFAYNTSLLGSIIAFDRYVLVCSPFKMKTSRRMAIVSVVVVLAFAFAGNIHFAMYGDAVGVGESKVCTYTGPTWLQITFIMYPNFLYLLKTFSCSFCYSMIYLKIKKHSKDTAYMRQAAGITSGTVSTAIAGNSALQQGQKKTENLSAGKPQELGHSSGIPGQFDVQDRVSEPVDRDHVSGSQSPLDDDKMATSHHGVSSSTENAESSKVHSTRSLIKNKVFPKAQITSGATSGEVPAAKPRIKKDRMTKMMFIVTVIYVFSVLPVMILENIPTRFLNRMQQTSLGEAIVNLLYQMRLIAHIINIFVYYGVNEHFKREANALFGKGTTGY